MILDTLKRHKIYLVSQSPRRQELLRGMGIYFDVLKTDVEENYGADLSPAEVVQYLSQLKLSPIRYSEYPENSIFIACDTIVVINGHITGKPHSKEDAFDMLHQLSGHTHTVLSGLTVALSQKNTAVRTLTDYRSTEVTFASLTDEEIDFYIDQYKPFDKAGSYGIQEWIGYIGINSIQGSVYNVIGLPTQLLWKNLKEITLNK